MKKLLALLLFLAPLSALAQRDALVTYTRSPDRNVVGYLFYYSVDGTNGPWMVPLIPRVVVTNVFVTFTNVITGQPAAWATNVLTLTTTNDATVTLPQMPSAAFWLRATAWSPGGESEPSNMMPSDAYGPVIYPRPGPPGLISVSAGTIGKLIINFAPPPPPAK